MEEAPLTWRVQSRSAHTAVELYGAIDERADFTELAAQLAGPVVFELGSVTRVSSLGARRWIELVGGLPRVSELVLSHCSPAMVNQLATIANFGGPARIRSFFAPYRCRGCDREDDRLIDVETQRPSRTAAPELRCDDCGGPMELDDVPERYLAFL